ncbi:MAG: hypothetical protein IJ150_04895 [Bacteroidales bacterium]|nr:hypothetical protein [Bacteroidales bacterium]
MNRYISKLSYSALLLMFAGSMTFVSCDDDDDDNDGADPVVTYFRTTHAEQADSMITAASLGQMIAIIGENLNNVKEISFNDQKAKLSTAYITENSIIVTVPNAVPGEITNKMYITAKNGNVIPVDFTASIPAPVISSMDCEYVADGETAYINGNYFVKTSEADVEVFFPGNVKAEIDEEKSTASRLAVKVPEGAVSGALTVKTNFGTTVSSLYFRDDRNMMLDFETPFNGWGKHTTNTEESLFNTYVHFYDATTLLGWNEHATLLYSVATEGTTYTPEIDDTKKYALKFECRVNNQWSLVSLYIRFFESGEAASNNAEYSPAYCWEPWATGTYGPTEWRTITIPISEFHYTSSGVDAKKTHDVHNIGGIFMFLRGGTGTDTETKQEVDMDIDNIRIVPID